MKLASKILEKLSKFFYHGFNSEKKIEDAYNYLKKNNQLKIIEKIRIEIEKKELKNKLELSYILKNNNDLAKTLNQILHTKLIVLSQFSSQLAISLHKHKTFYFPLPKEWLDIINNNGIKTNFHLSRVLFFIVNYFLCKRFFKIILLAISKNVNIDKNDRTIVYLPDIPNISFQENYLDSKYNFLFWLKDFLNINNKVTFIHNNKKNFK